MSNSAKGFPSGVNGDHLNVHSPCKGNTVVLTTHTAKEVKLSKRDKVGSVLSLLSAYCGNYRPLQPPVCVEEEKNQHTGLDLRTVLVKCLPVCNKCLYEKHF